MEMTKTLMLQHTPVNFYNISTQGLIKPRTFLLRSDEAVLTTALQSPVNFPNCIKFSLSCVENAVMQEFTPTSSAHHLQSPSLQNPCSCVNMISGSTVLMQNQQHALVEIDNTKNVWAWCAKCHWTPSHDIMLHTWHTHLTQWRLALTQLYSGW